MSAFWIDRHFLRRDLDPEVASRHHDAVAFANDLVDPLDRLRLFDLRDEPDAAPPAAHDPPQRADVARAAYERERHVVGTGSEPEREVGAVLRRERRRRHARPRQVDSLALAQEPPGHDLRLEGARAHARHAQPQLAVVEKDRIAARYVARQRAIVRREPRRRAEKSARLDDDATALDELDRAALHPSDADLRALQIEQEPDRLLSPRLDRAQRGDDLAMLGVRSRATR